MRAQVVDNDGRSKEWETRERRREYDIMHTAVWIANTGDRHSLDSHSKTLNAHMQGN